ncbi:Uncharacterized protein GQ600_6323 [Phytophthora cactorum]|nr:Uncharacterized protein GQ600_6323 [Phytophthora cactorum]
MATWFQKEIVLTAPSRGFHLVTREVEKQLPELSRVKVGMANLFIKHTSASLSINENCDPDVRTDLEDDMPGHIKSTLIGASVNIPITNGKFNLGTWQGIYLCEHRNVGGWGSGHQRKVVVTIQGSTA